MRGGNEQAKGKMSSCVESGLEGRHVYSSLMVFDKRFFYVASFLGHEISPTDPLKEASLFLP